MSLGKGLLQDLGRRVSKRDVGEFTKTLLGNQVHWLSLADAPPTVEVVEDGQTFAENARKKALGYARQTGMWTLSDDSGLVIDALDGAPGVHSARFAGVSGDRRQVDQANMDKVLRQLSGFPRHRRRARFECCLCIATPQRVLAETSGSLAGMIHNEPLGNHGFGYDPIFYLDDLGMTAAQLAPEQKNAISHRGKALQELKPIIEQLLANPST